MNNFEKIMYKIRENKEIVGIIGLGYVGLPLAVAFAKNKVKVIGFEKSEKKANIVNNGQNYIGDVKDENYGLRGKRLTTAAETLLKSKPLVVSTSRTSCPSSFASIRQKSVISQSRFSRTFFSL